MPRALFFVLALAGCADVNGPYCDGFLDCVPYRADEFSCWEFREYPRSSICEVAHNMLSATVVDELGGCYALRYGGGGPYPPGFTPVPRSHWCHDDPPDPCPPLRIDNLCGEER